MKITDMFFKLNSLETFTYTFEYKGHTYTEYIHGIITEYVETDRDGAPTVVKIKQVSNLKDYFDKNEVTFIERDFRLIYLQPLINYK